MTKTTIIFIACIFLLTSISLYSQENVENTSPKSAIGLHAGAVTGLGFSYRYFPSKFGFQLTGIPVFLRENGVFTSAGASVLYKLKESRRVDFISYFGSHFTYNSRNLNSRSSLHMGAGGGINLHAWIDVLDISFQAGYGVYNVNEAPFSMLTAEIGFYYRF